MIPVNELRVGNYYNESAELNLGFKTIVRHFQRVKKLNELENITGDPIPLTPEILEKCGFSWIDGYLSIDLKNARMRLAFCNGVCDKMTLFQYQGLPYDSAKEFHMNFGANHPCSLHQLQNIYFALTNGQELPVSL